MGVGFQGDVMQGGRLEEEGGGAAKGRKGLWEGKRLGAGTRG